MERFAIGMAVAVVLAAPTGLTAQDSEWNRYTLESLEGVHVSAEVAEACTSAGVAGDALTTAAEATLTGAEVALLTEAGMLAAPGLPELKLFVTCAPGEGGAIAFSTSVRLFQAAQMVRDPQITLSEAVTWYTDSVGVSAPANVGAAITASMGERVAEFAAAYVAANAG